jgi:hypothetical protein
MMFGFAAQQFVTDRGRRGIDLGDHDAAGSKQVGGASQCPHRVTPMPMLPSASRICAQPPSAGNDAKRSAWIAAPPRSRVSSTAARDVSTPSAGNPWCCREAVKHPGPQPKSKVGRCEQYPSTCASASRSWFALYRTVHELAPSGEPKWVPGTDGWPAGRALTNNRQLFSGCANQRKQFVDRPLLVGVRGVIARNYCAGVVDQDI